MPRPLAADPLPPG